MKRKDLRADAVPSKHPKLCCPHPPPADEEPPPRPDLDHAYVKTPLPPLALGLKSSKEKEEEEQPLPEWRMEMDLSPTAPPTAPLPFNETPPEVDLEAENERLRKERDAAVTRLDHVMECLGKIWGKEQIRLFLGDCKRVKEYSNETIQTALRIKLVIGGNGYELLRELGWPLPSLTVLNRSVKDIEVKPGLSPDAFALAGMKAKDMALKDVPEDQRAEKMINEIIDLALASNDTEGVLVLDEAALKAMLEFDPSLKCLSGNISAPTVTDPDHESGKQ